MDHSKTGSPIKKSRRINLVTQISLKSIAGILQYTGRHGNLHLYKNRKYKLTCCCYPFRDIWIPAMTVLLVTIVTVIVFIVASLWVVMQIWRVIKSVKTMTIRNMCNLSKYAVLYTYVISDTHMPFLINICHFWYTLYNLWYTYAIFGTHMPFLIHKCHKHMPFIGTHMHLLTHYMPLVSNKCI